jgi:predicted ATP-dependent endonuclease of OLD family
MRKIVSIAHKDRKNIMLYDAVAKEIFFSKGLLFVEGTEDANILRSYIELKGMPSIEIFGYGSGGAANLVDWLTMCSELGIRAFGLYDGDEEGTKQYAIAFEQFQLSPAICVEKLWASDIRDKPEKDGKPAKEGIFDGNWNIKGTHELRLDTLLNKISEHISENKVE